MIMAYPSTTEYLDVAMYVPGRIRAITQLPQHVHVTHPSGLAPKYRNRGFTINPPTVV